jgi:hypothetical protein
VHVFFQCFFLTISSLTFGWHWAPCLCSHSYF